MQIHDDEGEDDVGENDEGLDVEECKGCHKEHTFCCVMLCLMCCYNVERRVSIILRHLIKRRKIFFTRRVKGAIRSTRLRRSDGINLSSIF
jgi:hypothetical protein